MRVLVNDKEITLFDGATIIDAIRAFSPVWAKLLEEKKAEVKDQYGNVIMQDGELKVGQIIKIRKI